VVAAAKAPQLIDEANATRRGLKGLKSIGLKGKKLRKSRNLLLKAYGTYAGAAAGTVGGTEIARRVRKSIKEKQ